MPFYKINIKKLEWDDLKFVDDKYLNHEYMSWTQRAVEKTWIGIDLSLVVTRYINKHIDKSVYVDSEEMDIKFGEHSFCFHTISDIFERISQATTILNLYLNKLFKRESKNCNYYEEYDDLIYKADFYLGVLKLVELDQIDSEVFPNKEIIERTYYILYSDIYDYKYIIFDQSFIGLDNK